MSASGKLVTCLGLAVLSLALLLGPTRAEADFGIQSMSANAFNENGSPDLQAGSHPYEFRLSFEMNQNSEEEPEGTMRELFVELPPGMVGNPLALPRCPGADFEGVTPNCSGNTQIGIAQLHIYGNGGTLVTPIYNLTPPQGTPASIGFSIAGNNSFQEASLRSADYGVKISDITIPTSQPIQWIDARIWGLPELATHNPERFCITNGLLSEGCATDSAPVPFLTLPTSCTGPLNWTVSVDSVQKPNTLRTAGAESLGPGGTPRGLGGCGKPSFAPTISSHPDTTASDSPTGLRFDLRVPQANQLTAVHGKLEPRDEVQSLKLKASAGEFNLTFDEQTTGELLFDATAAEVQAALEGLSTIGSGNVSVSGGPGGPGGTNPYTITFVGTLSDRNLPQVTGRLNTSPGSVIATTVKHGQAPGETAIVGAQPELATAHLKDTVVTLPAGLAINPSTASGRGACPLTGPNGINLPDSGEPAEGEPAHCPESSKVGTVEVHTPLIDHPLPGTVYLAKQGQNPFGSLIALYVAVDDPQSGVIVKLAGKVEPDPVTGQLTATFRNNPQLPFEDFDFEFLGGPRAALTTPPTCGIYTTETDLTPWTAPEGKDVFPSDSFSIASAPTGTCPTSEAQMPNAPGFEAGTVAPLAGSFSPFVMKMSRENGSQRFANLSLTLPPGVSAQLAGVEQCSDAQLAAAIARSKPGEGTLEKQNPSCPAASQVGVVNVAAGSGTPFFVQGAAYLAGPYKGAPISLAIVTPAVAGPFDLGTVVVHAGLYVNEETAQVTVKSDQLPQILDGIPLDVRTIAVKVDRSNFTLNPTNCEAMAIAGSVTSPSGQSAPRTNRFQVGACGALPYKPKLAIRLKGATHRTAHPTLIATLTAKPGEANTRFAQVKLPKAAFLDNAHIGTVCTRVQFSAGAGNGERCPAGSIYGRAEATTPLLGYPLKGTVILRSSSHKLPDLVVAFSGPAYQPIHFALAGRTDSVKGALRNTFEAAPDVPVSKFRLELFGGKRGLVELSSGLCAHPNATVRLRAHDSATYHTTPNVKASCG